MTITSKFPGICGSCGCPFEAGSKINWVRGFRPTHVNAAACAEAKRTAPPPAPPVELTGAAKIMEFLNAAHERGLKYPKAHFMANGTEIAVSRAGEKSKYPGATQVYLGGAWVGRIGLDGVIAGRLAKDKRTLAALAAIAADPAAAATAYGMLTGRCCFCMLGLTDAGSVEVGYGAVCAKRFGLPHKHKGTPEPAGELIIESAPDEEPEIAAEREMATA
jgi:hypothetical protein